MGNRNLVSVLRGWAGQEEELLSLVAQLEQLEANPNRADLHFEVAYLRAEIVAERALQLSKDLGIRSESVDEHEMPRIENFDMVDFYMLDMGGADRSAAEQR